MVLEQMSRDMPVAAPDGSSCCKRCADILRSGSQRDCDGCCRKLHPTCSALPGDVYYQLRKSKKSRWVCDLCSAWVVKRDRAARVVRHVSDLDKSAAVHGATLKKKSRSTADLDLIESVSDTFGIIMNQLTEMKQINKNTSDHIRDLSESQENFSQTADEGTETIAKEENATFQDHISDLSKRKDTLIDGEVVSKNIPNVLRKEENTMEEEFDEVFEEDVIDESHVDWLKRTNARLSLKQSSVEFDFGLERSLQSDQAVRNFVSVASLSTMGSVDDKDDPLAVENIKLSFSCEDIVHSEEDSVGLISTLEDRKHGDISLVKNHMKYLLDKNKIDTEANSFNETGYHENVLNSAISTEDNMEFVVEEGHKLNQNLLLGGDWNNICDNEVISIFGK